MKRFLKWFLVFVLIVAGANLWIHWIFPTFLPESYAKWESDQKELKAKRDAEDIAEAKKEAEEKAEKKAERLAKKAAEKAKLESPDWLLGYATGEKDGAFLGHSDAIKGVERPTFTLDTDAFNVGDIADHLARHIDNKTAKEAYVRGFTHGYFQARSNTKAKMKAQERIN